MFCLLLRGLRILVAPFLLCRSLFTLLILCFLLRGSLSAVSLLILLFLLLTLLLLLLLLC